MGKPFFKKSHGAFYYKDDAGKERRLCADEAEAWRLWLERSGKADGAGPPIGEVCDQFITHHEEHSAPGTVKFYENHLKQFKPWAADKHLTFGTITPKHIDDWLKGSADKSKTYRGNLARSVKAACRWYAKQHNLSEPLRGYKCESSGSRKVTITQEQFDAIRDFTKDQEFRDVLDVLWLTGCRPMELRAVEAKHFDGRVWHFPKGGPGKNGRERTVVLIGESQAICSRLAEKHPTGKLFRDKNGHPWNKAKIEGRFARVKKAFGFDVSAYVMRHSFVTRTIRDGKVSVAKLAKLVGHSNTKMIEKHYDHYGEKRDDLLEIASQL